MKLIKPLVLIGILLFVVSFSTCYLGVKYAEGQIPPEIRRGMSDTDWVGIEWIGRGSIILLLGAVSCLSAAILWLRGKYFLKSAAG